EVYRTSKAWPRDETYGLVSQARRAAFSAAANIAEGAGRQGSREFRRFLAISLASLQELSYILRLVRDLQLNPECDERLRTMRESAFKLTWLLFRSMGKKNPSAR